MSQIVQYNPNLTHARVVSALTFMLINVGQVSYVNHVTGIQTRTSQVNGIVFLRILVMLMIAYLLDKHKCKITKRSLFYIWIWLFMEECSKSTCYDTITRVAAIIGVPRAALPFTSKAKGTYAATATITYQGLQINLRVGAVITSWYTNVIFGIENGHNLEMVEFAGIDVPANKHSLSDEDRKRLENTVVLIVEKEDIFDGLKLNNILDRDHPVILIDAQGCAAIDLLGMLTWFKNELLDKFDVKLKYILGVADNAPSGWNIMINVWEKNSEVEAEDILHNEVDYIGPFHEHEDEFTNLLMHDELTENDLKVIDGLKKNECIVNNQERLEIVNSFIEKGYSRQLEYYRKKELIMWIFNQIDQRLDTLGETLMDTDDNESEMEMEIVSV